MSNRLKMAEHHSIIGLARLNWSYRRIAAELGVDRQTVSRHVRQALGDLHATAVDSANAAISITGSPAAQPESNATISITGSSPAGASPAGRVSSCQPLRAMILQGLERGLTARRIWQDLKIEHGFAASYQSVQRFVRKLHCSTPPLPFRRMECSPGQEAQVDFGRAAPILTPDGKRKRPHLFRIVLSCSRKGYSQAVPRQTTEAFLRCIENAFVHFGGVPRTLVIDNLKAAVTQADWYEPELNPKILAFCQHYGTVVLPTRPRTPRHKDHASCCTSSVGLETIPVELLRSASLRP
jgi:transposase